MSNNSQSIHIKTEVLVEVIKAFLSDDYAENIRLIPFKMRPKDAEVPFRCCVYKERNIVKSRVKAGLGFSSEDDDEAKLLSSYALEALEREKPDENFLTVLDNACAGCVPSRIYVTDLCKGCVARSCETACKFGAITIENGRSKIDGSKCKNCKMCLNACPYKAIVKLAVPCEDVCPVGAIRKDENGVTRIDFNRCITCGRCVAACPFGAVNEKSQIIDILKNIKSDDKKVIAMFAPSLIGQFDGNLNQLKTAILKAGFDKVYEVAQGADITTINEAKEFEERMAEGAPFMTTSCCAGYNSLVEKHLPIMEEFKSTTKTPLYYTAEIVKKENPNAVTVFISPCSAKRKEGMENDNVSYVMTYVELSALFTAMDIKVSNIDVKGVFPDSSKQGRSFGISSGVAEAVKSVVRNDVVNPMVISGVDFSAYKELKKMARNRSCGDCNLVEVMCCEGGCSGGNATVRPPKISKKALNELLENSDDLKRD